MKTRVNGIVADPRVLVSPGTGRSEAERSETERSSGGETTTPPDPEVLDSADYKRQILAEADSAREPGPIGALLRREGDLLLSASEEAVRATPQGFTPLMMEENI